MPSPEERKRISRATWRRYFDAGRATVIRGELYILELDPETQATVLTCVQVEEGK